MQRSTSSSMMPSTEVTCLPSIASMSRQYGRRYAAGQLPWRNWVWPRRISYPAKIGDHVLYCERYLLVASAHEQRYTATRTGSGHHAPAQGRETSEALFYVYGRQMAEYQRPCQLLLAFASPARISPRAKWLRYLDYRFPNCSSRGPWPPHTGIACGRGVREYMRKDTVAHYTYLEVAAHGLTETVTEIALERSLRRSLVKTCALENETYIVERGVVAKS